MEIYFVNWSVSMVYRMILTSYEDEKFRNMYVFEKYFIFDWLMSKRTDSEQWWKDKISKHYNLIIAVENKIEECSYMNANISTVDRLQLFENLHAIK